MHAARLKRATGKGRCFNKEIKRQGKGAVIKISSVHVYKND
jgi:hypothetical protein